MKKIIMANDQKIPPAGKQSEMDADITHEEMQVLNSLDVAPESDDAERVHLDNTDDDGTRLNEQSGQNSGSGNDLDIPGSELDDDNEEIGEEDEENNAYSQADTE